MGTWAQLIGGTPSTLLGSGRSFTAQAAYATGQAAPLTSSWLSQTLTAVQTFQIAANVTVMSSLDVGGVVVSTPRRNSKPTGRCEGEAVKCVLIPTLMVCGLVSIILIVLVITYRYIVASRLSQMALYALDWEENEDKLQYVKKYHYSGSCPVPMQRPPPRVVFESTKPKEDEEDNNCAELLSNLDLTTTTATTTVKDKPTTANSNNSRNSSNSRSYISEKEGAGVGVAPLCDQHSTTPPSVGPVNNGSYAEIMDA